MIKLLTLIILTVGIYFGLNALFSEETVDLITDVGLIIAGFWLLIENSKLRSKLKLQKSVFSLMTLEMMKAFNVLVNRRMKIEEALKLENPEWTEQQIKDEVQRIDEGERK